MTDSIDLDDLDVADDEEPDANRGDWFWRGEGDPDAEPDDPDHHPAESSVGGATDDAVPRVPRRNDDSPVGVPVESGGSGGAPARDRDGGTGSGGEAGSETGTESESGTGTRAGTGAGSRPEASGPHGGGADDYTLALTYEAAKRLENLQAALADAETWTDWLGLVGDVDAHVLNKFQREHRLDLDFFNGSGSGPAERLADVDETSMFYANRMVVVGVEGEEWFADDEDWEFVPLEEAAAKAGWELAE